MVKALYQVSDLINLKKFIDDKLNPEWVKFIRTSLDQMGSAVKKNIYDHHKKNYWECVKCKSYDEGYNIGNPLCPYFDWYDTYHNYVEKGEFRLF